MEIWESDFWRGFILGIIITALVIAGYAYTGQISRLGMSEAFKQIIAIALILSVLGFIVGEWEGWVGYLAGVAVCILAIILILFALSQREKSQERGE